MFGSWICVFSVIPLVIPEEMAGLWADHYTYQSQHEQISCWIREKVWNLFVDFKNESCSSFVKSSTSRWSVGNTANRLLVYTGLRYMQRALVFRNDSSSLATTSMSASSFFVDVKHRLSLASSPRTFRHSSQTLFRTFLEIGPQIQAFLNLLQIHFVWLCLLPVSSIV